VPGVEVIDAITIFDEDKRVAVENVRLEPSELIYLVNGDNKITEVPVQLGSGVGSWIEVQGGVQAGQKVVTRGNERLMNGQAVQGQVLEMRLP